MRTPVLLAIDLARIVGETLSDGVVWAAVNIAELYRRKGWLLDQIN